MIDRTDLQLMICDHVMEMGTDELIDVFANLTGNEMEMYDEETDIVVGTVESLAIGDSPSLKKWLGFMLYALGERMELQRPAESD